MPDKKLTDNEIIKAFAICNKAFLPGDYTDGYYTKGRDRAIASWNSRRKTPAKTWVGDEN